METGCQCLETGSQSLETGHQSLVKFIDLLKELKPSAIQAKVCGLIPVAIQILNLPLSTP